VERKSFRRGCHVDRLLFRPTLAFKCTEKARHTALYGRSKSSLPRSWVVNELDAACPVWFLVWGRVRVQGLGVWCIERHVRGAVHGQGVWIRAWQAAFGSRTPASGVGNNNLESRVVPKPRSETEGWEPWKILQNHGGTVLKVGNQP
jgi:hypothetical protein